MNEHRISTLTDSYIYSMFNVDLTMTKRIAEAVKTGTILDSSYIQEQIIQIKRTRVSPLIDNVIKAYEDGNILLVYSDKVKTTQAVPFVVLKMGGKNKVAIFINNYGSITDNGAVNGGTYLNIPMKDLYVLMEGAYIAWSYYEYPTKFQRSIGLMKVTNQIYNSMFVQILNREYSLSMDQDLFNTVSFCISRFYLERLWCMDNHDVVYAYALQTCTATANRNTLAVVDSQYTDANIKTVDQLFEFLNKLSPRLETATIRYFVERYLNEYKYPALLSMDVMPYFLFTVAAAYCGSFIIKQEKIYNIIKTTKNANIFYSELSKLV